MASNYTIHLKNTAGEWGAIVTRNSSTTPVDATSGAPNRLKIGDFLDAGKNIPKARATVTAATNVAPIVLTCTLNQGTFADNDWVLVEAVGGNTNANGTFQVTSVTGNGTSMTLVGSAGNGAWTSGGKVRKLNTVSHVQGALAKITTAILNDIAAGN